MKHFLSLMLCAVLVLSMVPGVMTAEEGAPYVNKTGKPVTLTVFRAMDANLQDYITSWNETPYYQKMEELTGVHIEFVEPTSSAARETLNMLLISGEMPDIIIGSNLYGNGIYQAYLDGYFIDLAPYLPEYAPEYWSIITSSDEYWRDAADADGVISSMFRVFNEPNPAWMRLILKKELLDKLGVESVPATVADWENLFGVMSANGITPYVLASNGYDEKFMGAYDVMKDFYQVNGKIHYGQIEEGFRSYLTLMHDWYEKGYISKDFMSISNIDTLFAMDEIGTYDKPVVAAYNFGVAEGYHVLSTPYPRLSADQELHWDHYTNTMVRRDYDNGCIAVTSSCKDIETAIKWINFGYTAPGIELNNWGIEGLNFEYVDGKPQYLPAQWDYNGISQEGLNYYFKGHNCATYAYSDTQCHANLLKSPEAAAIREEYGDDPLLDHDYYLPSVSLTEEETEIRTEVMTNVDTYVNEMVLKFIIGTESLDNWDAYVATVEGMGIAKAIDAVQAAYDRYVSIVRPE